MTWDWWKEGGRKVDGVRGKLLGCGFFNFLSFFFFFRFLREREREGGKWGG